jgi:Ca2+-binding EF-hand superfamily protein
MYKECFKLMDIDKDGVINKADLRAAFDNVGKLMSEGELDDMMGEVGGECNFDNMIKMFQEKMAGGTII